MLGEREEVSFVPSSGLLRTFICRQLIVQTNVSEFLLCYVVLLGGSYANKERESILYIR